MDGIKYATLLPKNWLAETPETLASGRLGRQSKGSGFLKSAGTFVKKKLKAGHIPTHV
jgi:hypothetical protein